MTHQAVVTSKTAEVRLIESRTRARSKGVRVRVVSDRKAYETFSISEPGMIRYLWRSPDGWTCSCPGYGFTGMCHHLGQLARRAEREGWEVRVSDKGLTR